MSLLQTPALPITRMSNPDLLSRAVHQNSVLSIKGLRERFFTRAFRQLVYPQIWEDPIVDMKAMAITPECRILTIASGGCNALSYLTADPEKIIAIDLNNTHIALNRLKQMVMHMAPRYEDAHRFLVKADSATNVAFFDTFVRNHLDSASRSYWDGRTLWGRRRIGMFARGFYKFGLLGRFIGTGHVLARLMGTDLKVLLETRNVEEQKRVFETKISPLFDKTMLRALLSMRSSLFGLGIPPQQYDALAEGRPMAEVVCERLRKLACDFPIHENYFAWQAFGRCYDASPAGNLPPFLQKEHFETVRARLNRLETRQISFVDELQRHPEASLDRYVLLDAQDWMTDTDLTRLWGHITRTARPGARVIFRTAGKADILPGRVPNAVMSRWTYLEDASHYGTLHDRSAVYGGFHVYEFTSPQS